MILADVLSCYTSKIHDMDFLSGQDGLRGTIFTFLTKTTKNLD